MLPPNDATSLPGPLLNRTFLRQFSVVSGSGFWSAAVLCDSSGQRQSWIFPARPGACVFPDPDDGMQRKGWIEFGRVTLDPRSHQRGGYAKERAPRRCLTVPISDWCGRLRCEMACVDEKRDLNRGHILSEEPIFNPHLPSQRVMTCSTPRQLEASCYRQGCQPDTRHATTKHRVDMPV